MTLCLAGHRSKSLITISLIKAHKVLSAPCSRSGGLLKDAQNFAGLNSAGWFPLQAATGVES